MQSEWKNRNETAIVTEKDDDVSFYDSCGIRTTYGKEEFNRIVIPGDGYCMVNSVITGLKATDKLNRRELLTKVNNKFIDNEIMDMEILAEMFNICCPECIEQWHKIAER